MHSRVYHPCLTPGIHFDREDNGMRDSVLLITAVALGIGLLVMLADFGFSAFYSHQ